MAIVELTDRCHRERRYYVTSACLPAHRLGKVVRHHWRIENTLHWTLDAIFRGGTAR